MYFNFNRFNLNNTQTVTYCTWAVTYSTGTVTYYTGTVTDSTGTCRQLHIT